MVLSILHQVVPNNQSFFPYNQSFFPYLIRMKGHIVEIPSKELKIIRSFELREYPEKHTITKLIFDCNPLFARDFQELHKYTALKSIRFGEQSINQLHTLPYGIEEVSIVFCDIEEIVNLPQSVKKLTFSTESDSISFIDLKGIEILDYSAYNENCKFINYESLKSLTCKVDQSIQNLLFGLNKINRLEELNFFYINEEYDFNIKDLIFPKSVKKLYFNECCLLNSDTKDIVLSLPNLEELIIRGFDILYNSTETMNSIVFKCDNLKTVIHFFPLDDSPIRFESKFPIEFIDKSIKRSATKRSATKITVSEFDSEFGSEFVL